MDIDDGLITTMHPPGSANDIQYFTPEPPRELYRPRISVLSAIAAILAVTVLSYTVGCGASLICYYTQTDNAVIIATTAALTAFILVSLIRMKDVIIWCVLVYQHFARDDVRLRCLYTPSCSEYMIMSVMKYGALRGVIRGIKRLKRCHYPNGGHDYP